MKKGWQNRSQLLQLGHLKKERDMIALLRVAGRKSLEEPFCFQDNLRLDKERACAWSSGPAPGNPSMHCSDVPQK